MIVAIIQARMGSTRLPGKVLKKVLGKTLLEHLISRAKRARTLDKIIVATTTNKEDTSVAKLAESLGVGVFRGSAEDVLDRYYHAAKEADADIIVRITGDCPLIDPKIMDRVIRFFLRGAYDYVSNTNPPTFPDGMDIEVFSFKALKQAWEKARLPSQREHVTPYIINHSGFFHVGNLRARKDFSRLRLTVDNSEDLKLVRKIVEILSKSGNVSLNNILKLYKKDSSLFVVNAHIQRNEGYQKSLQEDMHINS